ncbi:MAG: hypothetical protein Q8Q32_03260, partial [bacterium]|nr:hypothetical protein [bacterium]
MRFRKFIKQLIYGLLYLTIIVGIVYLFYASALKSAPSCFDNKLNQDEEEVDCGGSCETCAIRHLKAIEYSREALIDSPIDGESILIFQLENPNPHFGAKAFNYTANFYPDNSTSSPALYQFSATSFIYPEELKTIIYPGVKIDRGEVERIEIFLSDINWAPREEYNRPKTLIRSVETEIRDEGTLRPRLAITGIFRNDNAYVLSKVELSVQLSGQLGEIIIASKTLLGSVPAFSDKEFELIIPLRPNQVLDLDNKPRITVEAQR